MSSELAELEIKELRQRLITLYHQYRKGIDLYFKLESQSSMFSDHVRNIILNAGLSISDLEEIQLNFFTNPEGFEFTYTVEQLAEEAESQ